MNFLSTPASLPHQIDPAKLYIGHPTYGWVLLDTVVGDPEYSLKDCPVKGGRELIRLLASKGKH